MRESWFFIDLPRTPYGEALKLQRRLVDARRTARLARDIVLLTEHDPVFTLGRHSAAEGYCTGKSPAMREGIPVVAVERGGNITYHGPGQLVVYPIVALHARRLDVRTYVSLLEETMIRTALHWNIPAERNNVNPGVWIGARKLGSVGIALRRGIAFHGFALNVSCTPEPFNWISPCGLKGIAMTSIAQEARAPVTVDEARIVVHHHLADIFSVELCPADMPAIAGMGTF
ncbi:MAG: lipoyl(octanoyl) transferase LipB [Deltaproteobacteria bacterium]|nr:lipoyl(octanoyl) transferase LipB [Deltaproteobacteria bacterium]